MSKGGISVGLSRQKTKYNLDYENSGTTDKAIKKLLLSHVTNSEIEEQVNKMGVKTRDENGNVRSLDSVIDDISRQLSSSIKHML